jgi:hypothetical protein
LVDGLAKRATTPFRHFERSEKSPKMTMRFLRAVLVERTKEEDLLEEHHFPCCLPERRRGISSFFLFVGPALLVPVCFQGDTYKLSLA